MITLIAVAAITTTALILSCERDEFQRSSSGATDKAIVLRDECDPCDGMDECCCFIQLRSGDAATLRLCGTSIVGSACSGPVGPCQSPQSGGGQFISLTDMDPKDIFCMLKGQTVRIINHSTTDNAVIRVGCNTNNVLPINLTIAPQDSVKLDINTSCEAGQCG
jgi:hypothetical protein